MKPELLLDGAAEAEFERAPAVLDAPKRQAIKMLDGSVVDSARIIGVAIKNVPAQGTLKYMIVLKDADGQNTYDYTYTWNETKAREKCRAISEVLFSTVMADEEREPDPSVYHQRIEDMASQQRVLAEEAVADKSWMAAAPVDLPPTMPGVYRDNVNIVHEDVEVIRPGMYEYIPIVTVSGGAVYQGEDMLFNTEERRGQYVEMPVDTNEPEGEEYDQVSYSPGYARNPNGSLMYNDGMQVFDTTKSHVPVNLGKINSNLAKAAKGDPLAREFDATYEKTTSISLPGAAVI